jgi:hypothetical protein
MSLFAIIHEMIHAWRSNFKVPLSPIRCSEHISLGDPLVDTFDGSSQRPKVLDRFTDRTNFCFIESRTVNKKDDPTTPIPSQRRRVQCTCSPANICQPAGYASDSGDESERRDRTRRERDHCACWLHGSEPEPRRGLARAGKTSEKEMPLSEAHDGVPGRRNKGRWVARERTHHGRNDPRWRKRRKATQRERRSTMRRSVLAGRQLLDATPDLLCIRC